jgi:hypothetical protein
VLAGPSGTDIDISHRRDKSPGGEVLLIEGRVFLPGLFLFIGEIYLFLRVGIRYKKLFVYPVPIKLKWEWIE